MTAYTVIPDSDINPDKPIKSETAYALRDNPSAIAEGDPTAPSINPAALLIGGKGGDGIFDNATPAITASGYYEFTSMSLSAARGLPAATIIRLAGNSTLSAAITLANRASGGTTVEQIQNTRVEREYLAAAMGAHFGFDASTSVGGASIGTEVNSTAGHPLPVNSVSKYWATRKPILGGNGYYSPSTQYALGGGSLILIIEGDLDCTGGTINAVGQALNAGGGGGSIIVIATGSITSGTFNANGGNGSSTGGGGGGLVQLVAASFIGTQTMSAAAGSSGGGGTPQAGHTNATTLTRDQIRTLLQRM
jgi:hypothetical protein